MSLKEVAAETLTVLELGGYSAGETIVELGDAIERAVAGTRLYRPEALASLLECAPGARGGAATVEVTGERTQEAARRLVADEGVADLVLLNFASARHPGGGFLSGARAQEEDLTRGSALYPCLQTQPDYYTANRAERSLVYTDHMIYSPQVPFFRGPNAELLEVPYRASVITAPAPNAGQVLRRDPGAARAIGAALRRRAGYVLAVAREHQHRTLLLGAWGCGVFRNDPEAVAGAFADWLADRRFRGAFDRVVFAVLDRSRDQANRRAFVRRFAAG